MEATYPLQRKEINEKKVNVQELQDLWPHLFEEVHFFNHLDILDGLSFREVFVWELMHKGPRIVEHMVKLSKSKMRALLLKATSAVERDGHLAQDTCSS